MKVYNLQPLYDIMYTNMLKSIIKLILRDPVAFEIFENKWVPQKWKFDVFCKYLKKSLDT